jgi:hypothetical protein
VILLLVYFLADQIAFFCSANERKGLAVVLMLRVLARELPVDDGFDVSVIHNYVVEGEITMSEDNSVVGPVHSGVHLSL